MDRNVQVVRKSCIALAGMLCGVFFSTASARAIDSFNPASDLSGLTPGYVNTMLKTVAIGGAHRAYMPASSQGLLGFDLGVDVTVIGIPEEFKTAFATASGSAAGSIPGVVPVPRINFHKGLPLGIDLGFTYISYQSVLRSVGADVKWTFLESAALPTLAARFSANYTELWFIGTRAYALDLVASKNLFLIEPYAGLGMMTWSGNLNVPLTGNGFPANLESRVAGTTGHVFVGLPIKFPLFRLTPEFDYSFAGVTVYGLKASFGI